MVEMAFQAAIPHNLRIHKSLKRIAEPKATSHGCATPLQALATTRENVSHRISFQNSAQRHCPDVAVPAQPTAQHSKQLGPSVSHRTSRQRITQHLFTTLPLAPTSFSITTSHRQTHSLVFS